MVETESKPRVNPRKVSEVLDIYQGLEKNTLEREQLLEELSAKVHSQQDPRTGEECIEICKGLLPPQGEYVLLFQSQRDVVELKMAGQYFLGFEEGLQDLFYFMRITEPLIKEFPGWQNYQRCYVNTGDIFIQFWGETVRDDLHKIQNLEDAIRYVGPGKGNSFKTGKPKINEEVPVGVIEDLFETGEPLVFRDLKDRASIERPWKASIGNKRIARALKELFGGQKNYDDVFSSLDFVFDALQLESKWAQEDLSNLSNILRSYFSDQKDLVCITSLDERSLVYVRAVAGAGFNAEHYETKSCCFDEGCTPRGEIEINYSDWSIKREEIVTGICTLNLEVNNTAQNLIYPVNFRDESAKVLTRPERCDVIADNLGINSVSDMHPVSCLRSGGVYISRDVNVPRFLDNNPEFDFHSATHRGKIITNPGEINFPVSNSANPVYSVFKKK